MGAITASSSCKSPTLFPLSLPKPPTPSQKFLPLSKQLLYFNYSITPFSQSAVINTLSARSVSSPETSIVEDKEEEEGGGTPPDDVISSNSSSLPPLTGCKACGREEIERGCNGEGRIQGGIATVPGFGWWPIKAYRPCPAFVASGGRYRRSGQSMDDVVSGRGVRGASDGINDAPQSSSSKKEEGPRKFKR